MKRCEGFRAGTGGEGRPPSRRPRRRVRATRLGASFAALVLAVALCGVACGASAAVSASGATTSVGGSAIGILLDSTPPADRDPALIVNDSYLGVLLATAASEDVTVTFYLDDPGADPVASGARVYHTETIGRGKPVPRPPDPVWVKKEGDTADFTFDSWLDGEGAAYDFALPVTGDLVLHAGWIEKVPEQKTADVTFEGCGGTMPDPAGSGADVGKCTVAGVLVGAHYPFPTDPVRTGYVFSGWFTAETGGTQVGADAVLETEGTVTLYAHWKAIEYTVCYHENWGTSPRSWAEPRKVVYDAAGDDAVRFADWDTVSDPKNGNFRKQDGYALDAWCATKDGTGERFRIGDAISNLTAVDGRVVDLYAVWKKDGTVEEGPFDVVFRTNDGTEDVFRAYTKDDGTAIPKEGRVEAFDPPKRKGYQFAGWWLREGDAPEGAPVRQWSFAEQVEGNLVLFAKWDLRLDVTVPVSVGFAVNADTGEVATPDAGKYRIQSRTVKEVGVDALALESREAELAELFEPVGGDAGWGAALRSASLTVVSGNSRIPLPLADEKSASPAWAVKKDVPYEHAGSFTLAPYSYGPFTDEEEPPWGSDAVSLPLAFEMRLPVGGDGGLMSVKTAVDGPKPITHLEFTVSAEA